MTTTHEQIRITKHSDHYEASLWVGQRFITAEGDTEQSARLSLLDEIVCCDDPSVVINNPRLEGEALHHARRRADLQLARSVRESWNMISRQSWAFDVPGGAGFDAIQTAAQIVHGGVNVDRAFIDGWATLAWILRSVSDAYPAQSEIRQRLDRLLDQ